MDKVNQLGQSPIQQYAQQLLRHSKPGAAEAVKGSLAADQTQLHQREAVANHVLYRNIEKHTLQFAGDGVALDKPENNSLFDAKEVARNVLNFVAGAIYKAKEDGADDEQLDEMMKQARKGVDMGFESAREELEDAGMLNTELKAGIDKSYDLIQDGLEEIESGDYQIQQAAVQGLQGLAFEQSRTGSLELETQEGDKVTISFGSSYAGAMAAGQGESGNFLAAQFESEQRVSFSVQGDLNDDELQAIADLIKQVDKVGEQFFSGNLDQAFAQAGEIGFDDEQLIGFALNYEQRQTVAVTAYQQQAGNSPLGTLIPDLNSFINDWQQMQDRVRTLFAEPERAQAHLLDFVLPLSSEEQQQEGEDAAATAPQAATERFLGFTGHLDMLLQQLQANPANRSQSE